jgi:hypothetical protein
MDGLAVAQLALNACRFVISGTVLASHPLRGINLFRRTPMLRDRWTLAALAVVMTLAVGCEDSDSSSTSSRRDRDGDGISDRYDRKPTDDNLRRSDPRDDDVVGRTPDRARRDTTLARDVPRGLPRDVVKVDEGVGDPLRYEAERDGHVYVYDEDDDRIVYDGKLYRGEQFIVDPESDVLSAGGKRLDDVNLRAQHRYRLYFARD